jgi:chemotaxis protein CheD
VTIRHDAGEAYLPPGGLHAALAPCAIGTLVGSCVAVTLWSARRAVGGMNHFLLPRRPRHGDGNARHGDVAMAMLLSRLTAFGCTTDELEARIFGGAAVLALSTPAASLGEQNTAAAWSFLRAHQLRVVDEQVGGRIARRLRLDVTSGRVETALVGGP